MHKKPIAAGYKRTAVDTAKTASGILAAALIASGNTPTNTVQYIELQAEAQAIRYTLDGTTPTATNGLRLPVGAPIVLTWAQILVLQVISETAGAFANTQGYSA